MTPVPVVVLAAGESRRLGSPKQLLPFRGKPLLAHVVETAVAAACGPVTVVLGSGADALRPVVEASGGRAVRNENWAAGMGASVRAGLASVEGDDPSAILFAVCDQPHVSVELFSDMVAAFRAGHELVACAYAGTTGVPVLFGRRYFTELRELPPDAGAKRLLARHASTIHPVPFPAGELDVDTPDDAAKLCELRGRVPEGVG